MNQEKEIGLLVSEVWDWYQTMGYSPKSMQPISSDLHVVSKHLLANGCQVFDWKIARKIIAGYYSSWKNGDMSKTRFHHLSKTIEVLYEYSQTGKIKWNPLYRWRAYNISERYEDIVYQFGSSKINIYQPETIVLYQYSAAKLFQYLESKSITSLLRLKNHHLSEYLIHLSKTQSPNSMRSALVALRAFFQFTVEAGLTKSNFETALQVRPTKQRYLQSYFTHEEVARLLNAVDRTSPPGKRDYAIMALAIGTGIRGIDIVRICFSDIDWENATIHITQVKTGHPLDVPVESSILTAITDYVENERPKSSVDNIFLRASAPYIAMPGTKALNLFLRKYALLAGIDLKSGKSRGFHCFRRSLGTWLLEAEVPLETISQILGHKRIDSAKSYMALNFSKLRECSLPLNDIALGREELF